VEGLDAGIYYYHPVRHQLIAVHDGPALSPAALRPADRAVCDSPGVVVLLIAQLAALQPVYATLSPALAVLDAGYMLQLLMSHQRSTGVGLSPLPGVTQAQVQDVCRLDATHLLIHCLAAGPCCSAAAPAPACDPAAGSAAVASWSGPDTACLKAVAVGRLDNLNALTPAEHDALHRSEPHLRRFSGNPRAVPLHPVTFLHNHYLQRSTRRSFSGTTLSTAAFSRFMALVHHRHSAGGLPARYHGPAGHDAVELLVHVKHGAVEGIDEGAYRYDQVAHALRRISGAAAADVRQAHFPSNRGYWAQCAFSLFCIGRLDVLQSRFGDRGHLLAMLEAGCIGQVLMDNKLRCGIGVCPIGALRFEGLAALFGLGPHHVLLHSFLCGPIDRDGMAAGLSPD
jgi:hypothetical protein